MQHVTEIVATAHQPSDEPRPALGKSRKLEMRSRSFGPAVHTLQRAYSKLLHENFENEWSSQLAANVRNLTDAIAWKLSVHSEVRAEEGNRLVSLIPASRGQVGKRLSRFSSQQPTLPEWRRAMLTNVLGFVNMNCDTSDASLTMRNVAVAM